MLVSSVRNGKVREVYRNEMWGRGAFVIGRKTSRRSNPVLVERAWTI